MGAVDWSWLFEKAEPWISAFAVSPAELPTLIVRVTNYGLAITAALAVIMALRRLPLIRDTMREFNEGRGQIWDLRNTAIDFRGTVTDLKQLQPVLSSMTAHFEQLRESVEIIRNQNIEAQLESTVERTDNGSDDTPPDQPVAATPQRVRDDANWTKLRRLYIRNARRLQAKVEGIPDGRTRGAYDRIGWKRPRQMVAKMGEDDLITDEVAQASLRLIEQFNAFKPRQRAVPDEVVGAMEVLDRQLEMELGPAPADEELG